jgi:SAM-dependent methyltransferase
MNRNNDTPQAPTLAAEAGPVGVSPSGAVNERDGLVDHDPTLKWIISDLAEGGPKTPPPLPLPTSHLKPNEPLPPPLPPEGKVKSALADSAANIPTPPPIAKTPPPPTKGPTDERIPPPAPTSEPRAQVPGQSLAADPSARPISTQGPASVVEASQGATPADFFSADPTPPPPPRPTTPGEETGAAPIAGLSETSGNDSELASDAVELIAPGAEDLCQDARSSAIAGVGQTTAANFPTESLSGNTPLDGIRLGESLPAVSDAPTEPREVEPDAVEMLESADYPTAPAAQPDAQSSHAQARPPVPHGPSVPSVTSGPSAPTPPPVPFVPPMAPASSTGPTGQTPSEPAAPAIPLTRPLTVAAALFDEYQTPTSGAAPLPEALARRSLKKRAKPWYEEVFDEDFLRTLPFMTPEQTVREVNFICDTLSPPKAGEILDVGCGYGRHALELAEQGFRLTGLDLSLPMLIRAADHAQRRGLSVNFVHADMREMTYNGQFDAAYCMLSSFGYFDEETNLRVATAICRALKPGGRFLLDIINRDYIVGDLPSRVWWEGDGCVVLEEVDFNYHTSRVLIRRSVVFGNGRQIEQEISLRAYSLHEVGKVLRQAGLRVLDVCGGLATRSRFYGAASRNIIAVCERPAL